VAWQFAYGYIVRCLLQLEDLLVDELRLLVHHEVRIQRTFIPTITLRIDPATCTWECYSGESRIYWQILLVLAVPALYVDSGGFGAEGTSTNDDPRYSDEVRDIGSSKTANTRGGDGGVNEELVFRQCFCDLEIFFAS
jgi:hypothetical protein